LKTPAASEPTPGNAAFAEEAARLGLLYRCPECDHVVPSSGRCSMGWPNGMLNRGDHAAYDDHGDFVFCKCFEAEGV
jgi:hypothetical protein